MKAVLQRENLQNLSLYTTSGGLAFARKIPFLGFPISKLA
jgi:hypothetical protein